MPVNKNKMKGFRKIIDWYFKRDSLPYWCIFIYDCLTYYLAGLIVFMLSNSAANTLANLQPLLCSLTLYLLPCIVCFRIFHTYSGIIRYSSFVDLQRLAYAMGVATIVILGLHYVVYRTPDKVMLHFDSLHLMGISFISFFLMLGLRVLAKRLYDVAFLGERASNVLIYGIMDGGVGLAKSIRSNKPTKYVLKGFISHDSKLSQKMLMGVRVYQPAEVEDILTKYQIKAVLVSPLRNDVFRNEQELQNVLIRHDVKILMSSMVVNRVDDPSAFQVNRLHDISIDDLLPRSEISVDMNMLSAQLKDRVVLVTGSAGSIGSEIVRQVASFNPKQLILIDQAETPQHDIRLMIAEKFPGVEAETIVASINEKSRMEHIFATYRPEYVFHAAAYKHVPMMEDNPCEAIHNNVQGTKNMADLAVKYGVRKFVMISTDKAVNPSNVMGCSKRICEIYVQSLDQAEKTGEVKGCTQFVTTRFGNVLGSNGSVIPLFEKQIREGGPVTVTDPNIVRFFMLIPEACKLVLEAGTRGQGGEIFVFDMGKPVRIADLARRMIKLSGAKNVTIKYTGLREGEKLYEEVLNDKETTKESFNPKIRIAMVRQYPYDKASQDVDELISTSATFDAMATVKKMKDIVPEFKSMNSIYEKLDYREEVGGKAQA